MRIYPLAGAFLGFEIYYHTVGRLFIGIVDFLAKSVKNFFYRCFMLVEKISAKIVRKFWCLPIVRGIVAWYNEQKSKKKAARAAKRRRKKMKKFGGVKNGF